MTPNKHYEVLEAVEILGTIREVGSIIELPEADAKPFVDAGALKEHGEGSAPAPAPETPSAPQGGEQAQAPAPETPAPAAPAAEMPAAPAPSEPAPVAAKKEGGWVGNHTVGGNEQAPLRQRHPDLASKAA